MRTLIAAMLSLAVTSATAAGTPSDPVAAGLLPAATAVAPGDTVALGLVLTVQDGWHIYWDGLNDTGMVPRITWDLPAGVTVGPLRWPAPVRHLTAGDILDHVLEGEVVALTELRVARDVAAAGDLAVACRVDWLACRDICVPGRDTARVRLPVVAAGQASVDPGAAARLDRARRSLPRPLPPGAPLRWTWDGPVLRLHVAGAAQLAFSPRPDSRPPLDLIRAGAADGEDLTLEFGPDRSAPVTGVLTVTYGGSRPPDHWILTLEETR